jgi:hypothetical protein
MLSFKILFMDEFDINDVAYKFKLFKFGKFI